LIHIRPSAFALLLLGTFPADPLAAQTAPVDASTAPDKSNYTLLNPTPDTELRDFCTDRPPKANLPCTGPTQVIPI